MKHDSILIKIREQRFYAGQIYRIESEPARSSNLTTATDALQRMVDHGLSNHVKNAMGELLARAGIATLHEHQEKVLERLLNEEDVVLAAPPGSGRGMVVCLGALYRSCLLYTSPSPRD